MKTHVPSGDVVTPAANPYRPLSFRWFLAAEGIRLYLGPDGSLRSLVAPVPPGEVRDWISANRDAIVAEVRQGD